MRTYQECLDRLYKTTSDKQFTRKEAREQLQPLVDTWDTIVSVYTMNNKLAELESKIKQLQAKIKEAGLDGVK